MLEFKKVQKLLPVHILVPASEYFPWRKKGYVSPILELRIAIGGKFYIMMIKGE